MSTYSIDVRRPPKAIWPIPLAADYSHPNGDTFTFTNYFLEHNGQPFFGVCGEFHYSRYPAEQWETELIKMQLGGINIVSTYVFWNHHEETQGTFRWEGDRDLRRFVALCAQLGVYAIVRVGPFAHGECRNGGFPDWLYGRPFELRSNDPAYLALVRRLYAEIGQQLRDLFLQDGGPIIAIQLENEYMHAGAPWEVAPRQAQEWVPAGIGGGEHMQALKQLAQESGLNSVFYTSTGWGGAPVLEGEILPLYGGYAFCPWNVTEQHPEHAPTSEYLFRSFHENGASWGAAEPPYAPEAYPFACCEMGGGMQVWYQYRFSVPAVSVEAMALMKIAGGCNFVGYYMYHGGSNPHGLRGFLNEHVTPRISYDFQAPLGEYGQVRDSYRGLRLLHQFASRFAATLCPMATVLPASNAAITPENTTTLRFAARVAGNSGFLFLNNYQDHCETCDLENIQLAVQLAEETLHLPQHGGLRLRRDTCAVLPFGLDLAGARLRYATAQLVTTLETAGETVFVFFAPEGMASEFSFASNSIATLDAGSGQVEEAQGAIIIRLEAGLDARITLESTSGGRASICLLRREQALQLTQVELWGRERLVLCNADLVVRGGLLELHSDGLPNFTLGVFPAPEGELHGPNGPLAGQAQGIFSTYSFALPEASIALEISSHGSARASVSLPADALDGLEDLLLEIHYDGDTGYASINGHLINDNFANGEPWQIGLRRHAPLLATGALDIVITPRRQGNVIRHEGAMAVQQTFVGSQIAEIHRITATPRYRARLALRSTTK